MTNYKRVTKRLTVVTLSALTLIGCSSQDTEEEAVVLDTEEQVEWVDDFHAESTQGQAMFEEVVDTFEGGYDALDDEQKADAIQTFVDSVQNEAHRLSSVVAGFTPELHKMIDEYPDVNFKTGENHEELPEGVVRGLLAELESSYAILIQQGGGQFVVGVDHERLNEEFGEQMNPMTKNQIELTRFEQSNSIVDYENGHLDFETIWEGLDVIESLNSDTEELKMQNELPRLFYYRALLGYEEQSMENDDGTPNEDAIAAMEALIEEHPMHRRSAHLTRLIEAIREEGAYGEESHKVADAILEEEFATLYDEMSDELGLEPSVDENSDEDVEAEENSDEDVEADENGDDA